MATPSSGSATAGSAVQYEYMFEENKSPTKQLDALLRAIARHIALNVGEKNERHLTPKKIAAFYRAVGGNYDSIFVDMPDSSISYIWQVTGCQHSLQPTDDDFAPPSIPALTPRGFSRWESVEILLGPEEHVPFMQYAVKTWNLRHPDTGESFPIDLPAAVFPSQPDAAVDLWHKACGERLTREAAKTGRPTDPKDTKPAHTYNTSGHQGPTAHANPWRRPGEPDYFGRSFSYANAPRRHSSKYGRPTKSPDKKSQEPTPEERERARRRSFSDFSSPPPNPEPPQFVHDEDRLDPSHHPAGHARRHSHPRHYSSSSDDEPEPISVRPNRRSYAGLPPPPSIRRVPPPQSSGSSSSLRPQRPSLKIDDSRRRSAMSPLGSLRNKFSETVSSILPNGFVSDRSRPSTRSHTSSEHLRSRKSRDQFPPSHLSKSYSDLDSDEDSDPGPRDEARRRRRRMADERDRDRDRDRHRDRDRPRDADREVDNERDSGGRRERPHARRPETTRRTSSHADIDRRGDSWGWETRDKERLREERRKFDRRSPEEEVPTPPLGVNGRRHPEPAYS